MLPEEIVIELTAACNFSCESCFNIASFAEKARNEQLKTNYVKKIIDVVANYGINRVRFSGGEPLLRPDLFELMEHAKSKNLKIWLNTNATLVTEPMARQLAKYVENILVPYNGYNEKSDFLWTRTLDSFEKKQRGVKIFKQFNFPVLRAGTVLTPENIENLDAIFKLTQGVSWEVWRPIPMTHKDDVDVEKLVKKLIILSNLKKEAIPIANAIPFCSYDMKIMDKLCLGAVHDDGHARMVVDPRGYVKPSYFIDKNIGSPLELNKCWNHEFMKKMRSLEFLPEKCNMCKYKSKCKGGSRYIANLVGGNYGAADPLMIS